jgi:hypothetical protein
MRCLHNITYNNVLWSSCIGRVVTNEDRSSAYWTCEPAANTETHICTACAYEQEHCVQIHPQIRQALQMLLADYFCRLESEGEMQITGGLIREQLVVLLRRHYQYVANDRR